MTEIKKEKFDQKIKEMRAIQGRNVTMFTNVECEHFIEKLKEFK